MIDLEKAKKEVDTEIKKFLESSTERGKDITESNKAYINDYKNLGDKLQSILDKYNNTELKQYTLSNIDSLFAPISKILS